MLSRILMSLLLLVHLKVLANVVGADTQNFNPTTNGLGFLTVHSSETLQPGQVNIGMFLDYAVNTLPEFINSNNAREESEDLLVSFDFNAGLGLTKNWEIGVSVPSIVVQEVDNQELQAGFTSKGVTEIALSTKYRFHKTESLGMAAILSVNFPLIENNPFTGDESTPIINLEWAIDKSWGDLLAGFNLGYRFRSPGAAIAGFPIEPLDDQVLVSMALSHPVFRDDTFIIGELFSSFPIRGTNAQDGRELRSHELLASIKHNPNEDWSVYAGAATELEHGTSSPDFRLFLGVNWHGGWLNKKEEPAPELVKEEPMVQEIPEPVAASPPPVPVNVSATQMDLFNNREIRKNEIFVVRDLNFRSGSHKLPLRLKNYLEQFASYLMREPQFQNLVIVGHTDSVGAAEFNQNLSYERASTVKRVLTKYFKLPAERIEIRGKGESEPIANNDSQEGRLQNRRVEFFVDR